MSDQTDLEAAVSRCEAMLLDLNQRVTTLERACVHQLETRHLLDRVGVASGVPVGTTSEHMRDAERGGSWGGDGA